MLAEERLAWIHRWVAEKGTVRVADLVRHLGISRETARRDLNELEARGVVRKVHGGAVLVGPRAAEPPFATRAASMVAQKQAIGAAASALIGDGESVLLDLGTTTLEVARHLGRHRRVTLITNSVPAALVALDAPEVTVYLVGGLLRPGDQSLSGSLTLRGLEAFYADKAVVGAGGLDVEAGLTDYHLEEAAVRREMIRRARQVIVVADHTKFGVTALASVCPARAIHHIVTDNGVDPAQVEAFRRLGIEVTVVPVLGADGEEDAS